jgi:hypothetical protein
MVPRQTTVPHSKRIAEMPDRSQLPIGRHAFIPHGQ